MNNKSGLTAFAPELFISNGVKDISFYEKAFGAKETMRFSNDDSSLHVAELSIGELIFHIHEVMPGSHSLDPGKSGGTTVRLGLFVEDVDAVTKQALLAGATEISPAQDYEYGYRQAIVKDPFGHYWQIQKKIG